MVHRTFAPTSVVYGDKQVRAFSVKCAGCSLIEKLPMNTNRTSGAGPDDDVVAQQVQTKLEKLGWFIGKREQDDLCPKCHKKKNGVRLPHNVLSMPTQRGPNEPRPENPNPVSVAGADTADAAKPATSEAKGKLTFETRRIIIAKLEDVYLNEASGYEAGWTDTRVARDLNVPREWVSEVRQQNFGPLGDNSDFRGVIAEASKLVDEMKAIRAETQREVTDLDTRVNEVKAKLAEMQRVAARVQPIEKKVAELLKAHT